MDSPSRRFCSFIIFRFFQLALLVCLIGQPLEVLAQSPLDGIKRSVERTANRARSSLQSTRDRASESVRRVGQRAGQSIDRGRDEIHSRSDRAQQSVNSAASRARTRANEVASRARSAGLDTQRQFSDAANTYGNSARSTLTNAYSSYSQETLSQISSARSRYGRQATDAIDGIIVSYGSQAGERIASVLAQAEQEGIDIANRFNSVADEISRNIRDPRFRDRVFEGAAVGSAVAYYAYKNQDELEYRATKHLFENVYVPTENGGTPIGELITTAILQQAPELRGTQLAEDPAAVIAYGAVAVGTEDIVNHAHIIPDRSGNLRTVNEAIGGSYGADRALDALLIGSSVEGLALQAAEEGAAGKHAQTFAATYNNMDEAFD